MNKSDPINRMLYRLYNEEVSDLSTEDRRPEVDKSLD